MVQIDPNIQVGGRFTMGNWGGEEMNWIVIRRDGNEVLALNANAVDGKSWCAKTDRSDTWEHCHLRQWLNGEFYSKAFANDEKQHIVDYCADNSDYKGTFCGGNTVDKVFLLSGQEVEKYILPMGSQSQKILGCPATASAKEAQRRAGGKPWTCFNYVKDVLYATFIRALGCGFSEIKGGGIFEDILMIPLVLLWYALGIVWNIPYTLVYLLTHATQLNYTGGWALRSFAAIDISRCCLDWPIHFIYKREDEEKLSFFETIKMMFFTPLCQAIMMKCKFEITEVYNMADGAYLVRPAISVKL